MRTDDLISALAADAGTRPQSLGKRAALALAAGTAVTAVMFFAAIGFRPDIARAVETVRFLFKFVVVLSLAVSAVGLSLRLARPGAGIGLWGWAVALAPALLAIGVVAELVSIPAATWSTRLVGTNAHNCLTIIPVLSAAPLAAMLLALRHGAPTRPRLAGGVAGLVAGAIAAFLYASNCTDDSPLFVATWYPIAIGLVAFIGSLLGPRLLKW